MKKKSERSIKEAIDTKCSEADAKQAITSVDEVLRGIQFKHAKGDVMLSNRIHDLLCYQMRQEGNRVRREMESVIDHLSKCCSALRRELQRAHERHVADLYEAHIGKTESLVMSDIKGGEYRAGQTFPVDLKGVSRG